MSPENQFSNYNYNHHHRYDDDDEDPPSNMISDKRKPKNKKEGEKSATITTTTTKMFKFHRWDGPYIFFFHSILRIKNGCQLVFFLIKQTMDYSQIGKIINFKQFDNSMMTLSFRYSIV